ncbi:uncharacterized protein LOC123312842 isoform X2 [Coccinella septempunctata]|uniref:uncharacterized protein LOC123312842 isoform X2 n=1 Tax=Coccinella septempunctata TaxID=41139 RepID=UPI001D07EFF6|nr:uncharacterized protein LOC123312842 isoform X2 [Coccinella septempunctata]
MADICNMTRKPRTRQTRIHAALQSGYCAICHLPYNSLDDHIQSKKHLKLIGEDANYISINGFIDQNSLEPFLNLNDVNGRQVEKDFCPRSTRNNRNRGMSMERITSSPMDSPIHHHLRSRKQINYAMSPSMDEDSFSERPDLLVGRSVKQRKSHRQIAMKKTQDSQEQQPEVWNSGRPKRRSCIKSKRVSADERLVVDNKTYYKVEVMTTKLRSSTTKEHHEVKPTTESQEDERDEKGLIVKFKKLRNSEITLLNNEAENFLFPKKDGSSSSEGEEEDEEEDIDADGANTTVSSCEGRNDTYIPSSDNEEDKTNDNFKTEDEASMDSTTSSGKSKKRRRTHAEAFIMDNEKYYKFETPGSRLRYHGSFFSEPNLKSPKRNGDMDVKETKKEVEESTNKNRNVDLNNYKFSFEMIPSGEKWFAPFRRQDLGEESYMYLSDVGSENQFIMPYQISSIPPLDPKICIAQYSQLKKMVQEQSSRTSCSTPDRSDTNYTPSLDNEPMDEDSKSSEPSNSIEFCSENSNMEESKCADEKVHKKRKMHVGRNPRKSPRQHASTLAILSSLIQQRKKKLKGTEPPNANPVINKSTALPVIPEECPVPTKVSPSNYEDILVSMNQEWDSEKLCDDLDLSPDDTVEFSHKLGILDVLRIYDDLRKRDDYRSNRRFISGSPVNKSGRRKKINKTGWPNRKKGLNKKDTNVKEETSSVGSVNDSEEEPNTTVCESEKKLGNDVNTDCVSNRVQVENNVKTPRSANKVKVSIGSKNINLQPFVKVKKLDSKLTANKEDVHVPSKKTNKRRMPASPKSPRMLRKPRGRWYKER